ncbi:MAG: hypothetical protein ACRCX2_14965 [Paraclostridium sp.]
MSKKKGATYLMNDIQSSILSSMDIRQLKFNPRPYQKTIIDDFDNGEKFMMLCHCRRMGKDMLAFYLACRLCTENPNQIIYYVFNTMKQGKQMILDGMTTDGKRIITEVVSSSVLDKPRSGNLYHNDNTLRWNNGSRIYFVDAQDVDTKVGGNLNLLVLSEMATYKNQNFVDYLIPSTLKVGGRIICVSTPRYGSKFNDMMLEDNRGRYKSIIRATSPEAIDNNGNPVYTQEELEYAKTQMSMEKYLQEYECDLNTANETSIYAFSFTMAKWLSEIELDNRPLYISFDLGFNDGQSLVFATTTKDGKVVPIHWYMNNNQPTKHYTDYIENYLNNIKKFKKENTTLILPHDGNNRQDGFSQLTSRAQMYRDCGFKVITIPALAQSKGIEILRSSIQNGDIQFLNNPIITSMVNDVKKYEWKITNGVNTFVPNHGKGLSASNVADSLEYLTIYMFRDKYIENSYKNFTPKTPNKIGIRR